MYLDRENGYEYVAVANCNDHYRRILAERQISVAPELNLNAEELAAHCLWELTFMGFSDEDVSETLEGFLPTGRKNVIINIGSSTTRKGTRFNTQIIE